MALQELATVSDALGYGFDTVNEAHLMRVCAWTQAEVGEHRIVPVATNQTTVASGPQFTLAGPVTSITSVTDEDGTVLTSDDWKLLPGGQLQILTATNATGLFTVVYVHGKVSALLVYFICQVAARLAGAPAAIAAGVQQETAGGFQTTYGVQAWRAQSGFTDDERKELRRLVPRLPKLIVMGQS